jgi:Protein of unknown function (DUF2950)
MSGLMLRRGLLAGLVAAGGIAGAAAQQAAKLQGFPTANEAATALTAAVRGNDEKALAAMLGEWWRVFVPSRDREFGRDRSTYLAAWDQSHKVTIDANKAIVEVGSTGWTLPIPIVKDGAEWRFDSDAGIDEIVAREIGRDELGAIQTLLAIVDAQRDYAAMDPMKTGSPVYARRLLSLPGKKDGLYWPTTAGEPESPLGRQVAEAQPDGAAPGGHYGYNFRLLYAQGPAAPGGTRDYLVNGRMLSFAAIAWPADYGETGIMTFMVGHDGIVYQRDLGPETRLRVPAITAFNPDKDWAKADTTPP